MNGIMFTQSKSISKKTTNIFNARTLAMTAMLSAVSYVLAFIEFPVPLSPSFAKMDFSDFPVLIGAFAFGPAAGVTIERTNFSFGDAEESQEGYYYVTDKCIGCKLCYSKCPQKCIDISVKPVVINQNHCLHCGNCFEICPMRAIVKRG